jgi:hypothetical protein
MRWIGLDLYFMHRQLHARFWRLLAKHMSFEPDLGQRELSKLRCQLPHMLGCHHHLHHMRCWKDCRVRGLCELHFSLC